MNLPVDAWKYRASNHRIQKKRQSNSRKICQNGTEKSPPWDDRPKKVKNEVLVPIDMKQAPGGCFSWVEDEGFSNDILSVDIKIMHL